MALFIENDFRAGAAFGAKKPAGVRRGVGPGDTCRFMRATVFTDATLAKQAGRFVWLSIDTEEVKNAAFLERFPFEAVPTFEVVDPNTEKIAYTWIGAVDVAELVRRFDEATADIRLSIDLAEDRLFVATEREMERKRRPSGHPIPKPATRVGG
jgi:hypothetical protein